MDNALNTYRNVVIDILSQYAKAPALTTAGNQVEEQLILDTERDHYQILTIGWEEGKRGYYPVFHIDVRNGKVWVQEDATDFDIVGELEKRGVKKSDIVLAFQPQYKRELSGYAVA